MENEIKWGYFVNIESDFFRKTFWDIAMEDVTVILNAYINGLNFFTISGKKYGWGEPNSVRIFYNHRNYPKHHIYDYARENRMISEGHNNTEFISDQVFIDMLILDVTKKYLGNNPFGYGKIIPVLKPESVEKHFINPDRIQEIKNSISTEFDLSKLIRLSEELNYNYNNKNYYSVGMLCRAIIDHIAPLFGYSSFNQVSSEYGNKSIQKCFKHLNESLRSIGDGMLHHNLKEHEILPNETQVNFSQDFDVLFGELIRILKKN